MTSLKIALALGVFVVGGCSKREIAQCPSEENSFLELSFNWRDADEAVIPDKDVKRNISSIERCFKARQFAGPFANGVPATIKYVFVKRYNGHLLFGFTIDHVTDIVIMYEVDSSGSAVASYIA